MLPKRLMACAALVRRGAKVCDVGTDHALLPCYLAKEGISPAVIASDVNEKPLLGAARTIFAGGLYPNGDHPIVRRAGGDFAGRSGRRDRRRYGRGIDRTDHPFRRLVPQ